MSGLPQNIEAIHPSLWLGSQLARAYGRTVDTGFAALSAKLPGGGWPIGSLIELLVQQAGVGEIRLLQPALKAVAKRPIVLIKPVQTPNSLGFAYSGIPAEKLMLLKGTSTADVLWSAEQILKAGTCGAVLLWQQHIRAESLRRLSLNAQSADALFFVIRPLASQLDSSPASLRLSVRPSAGGVFIDVVKRRGPSGAGPFEVVLPTPVLLSPFGRPSKPARTVERDVPFVAPASV